MKRFSRNLLVAMLGLCLVGLMTETASAKWIIQYRNGRRVRIWIPDDTDILGRKRVIRVNSKPLSTPLPPSTPTTSDATRILTSPSPWAKKKP
jgi:hypothetical protein